MDFIVNQMAGISVMMIMSLLHLAVIIFLVIVMQSNKERPADAFGIFLVLLNAFVIIVHVYLIAVRLTELCFTFHGSLL